MQSMISIGNVVGNLDEPHLSVCLYLIIDCISNVTDRDSYSIRDIMSQCTPSPSVFGIPVEQYCSVVGTVG